MKFRILHEMVGPFRINDVVDAAQFPFEVRDASRHKAYLDRLIGLSAIAAVPEDTPLSLADPGALAAVRLSIPPAAEDRAPVIETAPRGKPAAANA
jgi:hypothetical protein